MSRSRISSRTPQPPSDLECPPSNMVNTISPALQLPSVDFGFDELKEQMNRFTIRFDEFIEKGRKRLLMEKNEFARNVAEDKEAARDMKAQIDYYKEKEKEVEEQTKREAEEAADAELTIASMTRTQLQKSEVKSQLLSQISTLEATIAHKRSLLSRSRTSLATLSSHNLPELTFWEDNLGMRIEGAGVADHLKIVFTHVLESDWEKEYVFVVNMSKRDYEVVQCRPRLPEGVIQEAVGRLNETRNFGGFLKEMRMGFVELGKVA